MATKLPLPQVLVHPVAVTANGKFQYANALTNTYNRMTRYGLKLEVDLMQVPIQTTVRPPFESFRLVGSPDHFERKVHLGVFAEQHYDQCKRYQWSKVNIDFISPQQDLIAEAILSGLAVSSTCP